jgi:hypothetical protein
MYGSVRGVPGNRHSYRDPSLHDEAVHGTWRFQDDLISYYFTSLIIFIGI